MYYCQCWHVCIRQHFKSRQIKIIIIIITILALSQSITWFSLTTWSVMADLCLFVSEAFLIPPLKGIPSPIFSTSSLCFLTLVLCGVFVSPTYIPSQLLQSMVYTPSLGSTLSLGQTKSLLKVVCGFIAMLTPLFIRILTTFSISPFTYGSTTICLVLTSSLSFYSWSSPASVPSCWLMLFAHCGYPHTFKASLMVSFVLSASSDTILSHLSVSVLATPIFWSMESVIWIDIQVLVGVCLFPVHQRLHTSILLPH